MWLTIYTDLFTLNISDFNLLFMSKLQPPLKKVNPLFPNNSLWKLRSCQVLPFWKFGWRFNPPLLSRKGRGCTPYNQFNILPLHTTCGCNVYVKMTSGFTPDLSSLHLQTRVEWQSKDSGHQFNASTTLSKLIYTVINSNCTYSIHRELNDFTTYW